MNFIKQNKIKIAVIILVWITPYKIMRPIAVIGLYLCSALFATHGCLMIIKYILADVADIERIGIMVHIIPKCLLTREDKSIIRKHIIIDLVCMTIMFVLVRFVIPLNEVLARTYFKSKGLV